MSLKPITIKDFSPVLNRLKPHFESKEYKQRLAEYEKRQEELKQQNIMAQFRASGLPKEFIANDKPFKLQNDSQRELGILLNKWDSNKDFRLPYIYGSPGVGKSCIAMRFAHNIIKEGYPDVKFVSCSQFLIGYRDFTKKESLDDLTAPNVLILDDLGSHNTTRIVVEVLHAAFDYRIRNKKPTLITSNVSINGVSKALYNMGKKYDVSFTLCSAIEDRLYDLCNIFHLKGSSLRLKKALERV